MLQIDLCTPPEVPDVEWLNAFAVCMMRMHPHIPSNCARQLALLAHDSTWLLDPPEAAELWENAVRSAMPLRPY